MCFYFLSAKQKNVDGRDKPDHDIGV